MLLVRYLNCMNVVADGACLDLGLSRNTGTLLLILMNGELGQIRYLYGEAESSHSRKRLWTTRPGLAERQNADQSRRIHQLRGRRFNQFPFVWIRDERGSPYALLHLLGTDCAGFLFTVCDLVYSQPLTF